MRGKRRRRWQAESYLLSGSKGEADEEAATIFNLRPLILSLLLVAIISFPGPRCSSALAPGFILLSHEKEVSRKRAILFPVDDKR